VGSHRGTRPRTRRLAISKNLQQIFLIGDYKTWGEVYEAAGIEPPKAKPKTKDTSPGNPDDINNLIRLTQNFLSLQESGILRYEPGTKEYIDAAKDIKEGKERLKELKQRLITAEKGESEKEKTETFQEEKGAYEAKVKAAQKKLQVAKDTDGDVAAAEEELKTVTSTKPFARDYTKTDAAMAGRAPVVGQTPTTPATPTTPKGETPPKGGTGSGKDDGKKKETPLTDAERREQALDVAAETDFALPETIFNNVPSLKRILNRYVKENWTESKLRKAIRDDVWYRKNSAEIKARYVQLYNYRDLVATGQADGSTDYEKQISTLERQIADKARAMGSAIASDPEALRRAAENMYITNVGIDDAMTTDFIAAAIRPIVSTIGGQPTEGYSGQALRDYQAIQDIARSNGFRVKDIIPGGSNERQVLEGIATGRLDANRIAQDARRLAMQGQPEYVRDLLSQGYNLDQVFAPYRQTMANLLEINADEIDLNDSTLQSAISDKGDMNLYDFKKTLKADKRWQYTENAKSEVSDITLKILRDFGFQG
jgi:hypothetical protein